MNTQLSPEEIQRYKQEMMKMYQGAGNKTGGSITKSQKVTATNAAAGTAASSQAAAPSEKSSLTVIAGRNAAAPAQNAASGQTTAAQSTSTASQSGKTAARAVGARFEAPDVGYIENVQITDPEPEYAGTYYPDTGAIGVPQFPGNVSTGPAAAPSTPRPPVTPPKPPVTQPKPPSNIQTPDTGYIEAPDFPEETTGTGYLRVQVHTANRAIPVPDAMLIITEETPLGRKLIHMSITDENGYSDLIPLEVPVYPLDEFPNPESKPYRDYRLSAFADGYYIIPRIEVPIFSDIKSLQSVEMIPLAENTSPLSLFPSSTSESDTSITSIEFEQS